MGGTDVINCYHIKVMYGILKVHKPTMASRVQHGSGWAYTLAKDQFD